jgi:hypothetical protein
MVHHLRQVGMVRCVLSRRLRVLGRGMLACGAPEDASMDRIYAVQSRLHIPPGVTVIDYLVVNS